jgi:hypothetical protein
MSMPGITAYVRRRVWRCVLILMQEDTPLHEAARTLRAEHVPTLLKAGADVNAKDDRVCQEEYGDECSCMFCFRDVHHFTMLHTAQRVSTYCTMLHALDMESVW